MSQANLMVGVRSITRMGIGAPLLLVMMLAMMVLPLPPLLLDVLFTFNISLSLVVLLSGVYSKKPLDFSSFPTVLLVATLLRLALNVASTRVVLLEGHTGTHAAGHVIQAFGEFVVGGNYAVGMVVFAILVIVNFVVVTKGAGRISEVSARFTLDAMPGKQMAIDADLNAGLIIGMLQHGMTFGNAMHNYSLLTIGDGLVAQIPSLVLSTAAALMVTRVTSSEDMGQQILDQLFANPKSLIVTAGVLGALGVIPGMPNLVFLSLAAGAGAGAYYVARRNKTPVQEVQPELPPPVVAEPKELGWDDVQPVDTVGLEVGYRLIPLGDKNHGGQLMTRIKGVRKKLTCELGFLVPAVHIRDNLDLAPNAYRLSLLGVTVGEAEIYLDRDLAINPGQVYGKLSGIPGKDPAFGLDAVWIEPALRDEAQTLGYTVVDASTVIATHLSQILQDHAHDLLGREEVQHLLDNLAKSTPKLVEDLVPGTMTMGAVLKVLR